MKKLPALGIVFGFLVVLSGLTLVVAEADADLAPVPGTYSCCGSVGCTTLSPLDACPNGDQDCKPLGEIPRKCCVQRCNDPQPVGN